MRDKVKRNFVCVKIIKIKNIPKKEREATRVEVDLLRRLNHPNIVRYIDSFLSKNGESLCICMEYCDGVSHTQFVRYTCVAHKFLLAG
jgi:NIMA (never in mitosis gene a)-related kinase